MSPTPIVPDYTGANVRGIIPALPRSSELGLPLPDWMPSLVAEAKQFVLLVLDGLGWDQLQEHAALIPTLASMDGGPITTVAPTTTATALTSITTGLTPGEHGLIGYRMVRRRRDPQRAALAVTATTACVDPSSARRRSRSSPSWARRCRSSARPSWSARVQRGPPAWLGAGRLAHRIVDAGDVAAAGPGGGALRVRYYGGIDKIAHERGFGALLRGRAACCRRTGRPICWRRSRPGDVVGDGRPRAGRRR